MTHPLHSSRIAAAFGRRAGAYDSHAGLQRRVAELLARHLPPLTAPRILEIGLMTRHLAEAWPDGEFLITDIAPAMVDVCRAKFAFLDRARFAPLDAQNHDVAGEFDLIVSSMAAQWFDDPAGTLEGLSANLAPGGQLLYATTGPDNLREWVAALQGCGLPPGRAPLGGLPGIMAQQPIVVDYGSARDFLNALKAIGAVEPSREYASQRTPGRLRHAIRLCDAACKGKITWHIVFGRLEAPA
jgi:malonyl-CoA O-methyltransferase